MSGKSGDVAERGRHDRLLKERVHDPYMTRYKPEQPLVCPRCGVGFNEGRWQWLSAEPGDAKRDLCPACQRIHDKVPAGYLTLGGEFFQAHRDEIMRLVNNKVEAEKAQHPMKRIMDVDDSAADGTLITFTDMHLPRGVGEAIASAYEGELDIQYTDEAGILRVYWRR